MDTELRIWRVALRLFAERGFVATGIRDLAAASGITTAALYHYIGTKEDLLLGIMRDGLGRLLTSGRRALDQGSDPATQLASLMANHVIVHTSNPRMAQVIDQEIRALSPSSREEVIAIRDEYEALWRSVLAEGTRTGVFKLGDARLGRLALLEMGTGVAYWYSPTGRLSARTIAEHFADMALSIVAAHRGEALLRIHQLDIGDPAAHYEIAQYEPPITAIGTTQKSALPAS